MKRQLTVVEPKTVAQQASDAADLIYDGQAIVRVVAALMETEEHDVSNHMIYRALKTADQLLERAGSAAVEISC